MFPCTSPQICGVQNHRDGTICEGQRKGAWGSGAPRASATSLLPSKPSTESKMSTPESLPTRYSFKDTFGREATIPFTKVPYGAGPNDQREVVEGEPGSEKQLISEALGNYLDRYESDPDFDESEMYNMPPFEHVSDYLERVAGRNPESQEQIRSAYDSAYNDAVDHVLATHADKIRSGEMNDLVEARSRYRSDLNEFKHELDDIDREWWSNKENYGKSFTENH